MIGQIQEAGLSGMTGKSTKHGKSSLFAKLLAMLEKNAELSGKGKGLQLHEGKLSKGKSGLADKLDPLALAKAKHLLALAAKEKTEQKDKVHDDTASLLVAHVIVDQQMPVKKTLHKDGETSVLIAGRFGDQLNANAGLKGEANAGLKGEANAGLKGEDKNSSQIGKNVGAVAVEKNGLSKGVGAMAQTVTGKEVDALVSQQKEQIPQQLGSTKAEASTALLADKKNVLLSEQAAQSLQLAQKGEPGVNTQATIAQAEQAKSMLEGQKLTSGALAVQGNHSLGETKDGKAGSETINAAALFQQAKASQSQQAQQLTNASLTATAQMNIADASRADSGSQFSDNKGGQDPRLLGVGLNDLKLTGSSSTDTNFKTYLTNKTTPTMTVFDSMNYIAQSAKNGQTKIEIQLDPIHLGKIQISLQTDASKHLQIHMIVDQSMTRAALEQQLPQLRSALAQQGFDLSGFSMDSQQQQASSGGEGNQKRTHTFGDQAEATMGDIPVMETPVFKTGSGLSVRV